MLRCGVSTPLLRKRKRLWGDSACAARIPARRTRGVLPVESVFPPLWVSDLLMDKPGTECEKRGDSNRAGPVVNIEKAALKTLEVGRVAAIASDKLAELRGPAA